MNTKQWVIKQMTAKGWKVKEVSYERPHSGFKSVDGGWLCFFETEYDDDDFFEQIKAIGHDPKINGTIDCVGVIMAMTAADLRKLINKVPIRNNYLTTPKNKDV